MRKIVALMLFMVLLASLLAAQDKTSNLNLNKPRQGSTSWGAALNANLDALDSYLSGGSILDLIRIQQITILGTPANLTDAATVGFVNAAIANATVNAANSVPWTGVTNKPSTFAPPAPSTSTLGGVKSKTCTGTDKISAIGTDGVPVCSADQTAASGTGITSLNGSGQSSQSFVTGTTGTAPSIATNAGTGLHTFNFPLASAAGVTAGMVDNARWQKWNTKQITFIAGGDNGSTLDASYSQNTIYWNKTGYDVHITSVSCESDSGAPTINIKRDDGSPANVLSANLTCSSAGATSSSFTSGEDAVANGHKLDFVIATNDTAKRITVAIVYTLD